MNVIHDLLDAQIIDRRGRRIGRVDGVWLRLSDDRPPRITAVESGIATISRRISRRWGRFVRAWIIRRSTRLRAVRIPVARWRKVDVDLHVDVDATDNRTFLQMEKWLARTVVSRIPGGSG
jgi:hypothetical protein